MVKIPASTSILVSASRGSLTTDLVKPLEADIGHVAIAVLTATILTLLCVRGHSHIPDTSMRTYIPGICVYVQLCGWFRPWGMSDKRMRPLEHLHATYEDIYIYIGLPMTSLRISTTPWIPPRGLNLRKRKRLGSVACWATGLEANLTRATLESVRRRTDPLPTYLGLEIFKVDAALDLDNVPGRDSIESTLWRGQHKKSRGVKGASVRQNGDKTTPSGAVRQPPRVAPGRHPRCYSNINIAGAKELHVLGRSEVRLWYWLSFVWRCVFIPYVGSFRPKQRNSNASTHSTFRSLGKHVFSRFIYILNGCFNNFPGAYYSGIP